MVTLLEQIHPLLVEAVADNAERQAFFVGECLTLLNQRLKDNGFADGAQGLPAGFLLELGAIGQLLLWENAGLRPFLPAELPTVTDAAQDLYHRADKSPKELYSASDAYLSRQVMQVWIEHVGWSGQAVLEAELAFGPVDEDRLVEAAAQLLWKHRKSVPKEE